MRKLIILLFKKFYGLDFKIKYDLMDLFTYFKVVFYFLLPVFYFFS